MYAFSRGVTAGTLLLLALALSGSAPEARRPRPTGVAAGSSALPGAAAIRAQIAKLPEQVLDELLAEPLKKERLH